MILHLAFDAVAQDFSLFLNPEKMKGNLFLDIQQPLASVSPQQCCLLQLPPALVLGMFQLCVHVPRLSDLSFYCFLCTAFSTAPECPTSKPLYLVMRPAVRGHATRLPPDISLVSLS